MVVAERDLPIALWGWGLEGFGGGGGETAGRKRGVGQERKRGGTKGMGRL